MNWREQLDNVSRHLGLTVTEHKVDERLAAIITFNTIVCSADNWPIQSVMGDSSRYGVWSYDMRHLLGKRVRVTVEEILE